MQFEQIDQKKGKMPLENVADSIKGYFTCSLFSPLTDTDKLNESVLKLSPTYFIFTLHQHVATLPPITFHHPGANRNVLLFSTGEVFPGGFAVSYYPICTSVRFVVVTQRNTP